MQGKIGISLYTQYFSAGGGTFLTSLMFFICILTQVNFFLYISSTFKRIELWISLNIIYVITLFVVPSVLKCFKVIIIKAR